MNARIFLHYTQEELDRAYDQRIWAANAEALMARWRIAVAGARADHAGYCEMSYGAHSDETLDLYPTAAPGAPIHLHIHGGAWRAQTKEDGAFAAPAMTAAGMHFVVPNFGKLPATRMPDVIDQLIRAVAWVHRKAESFGADGNRILLSGHSSGAHMAAVLATVDWRAHELPGDVIGAVVCISGAYDLEAVLLSARRGYMDLSAEEADRFSAPRNVSRIACPVSVLYGHGETPEFIRQAREFADALAAQGRLATFTEVFGSNHFEMAEAMADPASPVHRAILTALAAIRSDAPAGAADPEVSSR